VSDQTVNLVEDLNNEISSLESDKRKRLFIKTFGCQMNEYDSQKIAKILEKDYFLAPTANEADLVIINTCSVRDKPEQKLYSILGQVREIKKTNPQVRVGVGGCVAQQEGVEIVKHGRGVDFVFGTHNLSLVPSLILKREELGKPQVAVDYRDEWEELPLGLGGKDKVSTFVSISRGCNKNCSYCIVPTTRGREVSRAKDEILREVKIAIRRGAREIVLLGQTVNSYGLDLSPRLSFVDLMEEVSQIDGVERIRFTSPHPQEIRKDFINLVISNPKICRHVHMPLQSGSDRILKLMNRNYRRRRYLDIINSLKGGVPDIGITTDIIVGFPTETEQDFLDTLDVMREVGFQNSYSFMFSPRPSTIAAQMVDDISSEEKLSRLHRLQELQAELCNRSLEYWVGKDVEVLIEGSTISDNDLSDKSSQGRLQGRSSQNIMVHFSPENNWLKSGDIIPVKITSKSRHTLRGEPIIDKIDDAIVSRRGKFL
jgi:tRNA-2-methylthio-N6-dimethylallyladenosine synthase